MLPALSHRKWGVRGLPWNHWAILLVFLSKPALLGICSSLNQRMMTSRERGREGRSQILLHGETEHQQSMRTKDNINIHLFLNIYETSSWEMVSVTSAQYSSLNIFNFLKFVKVTMCFCGNHSGVIFIFKVQWHLKHFLTELKWKKQFTTMDISVSFPFPSHFYSNVNIDKQFFFLEYIPFY